MSKTYLNTLLSAGNEAFDENGEVAQVVVVDAPVVTEPEPTPADDVPPVVTQDPVEPDPEPIAVVVAINEDEKELVIASTEAANAEIELIEADCRLEEVEDQLDDQIQVVAETENVVASMESFVGSSMTLQDAQALQHWVHNATRGEYDQTKVVGSLEAFGNDVSTDDALSAGLEGIGEFLKAARNKAADLRKVMVARWSAFFKDAFVGFDKVARRAEALAKLAKNTAGESNASTIQLPLDTAWRLVREGKVSQNLPKDLSDLGKFTQAVFKTNGEALIVHRKKLVDIATRLSVAEYDDAVRISKELVGYPIPDVGVCKTKVVNNSNTVDLYRSDEMLGGVSLFYCKPVDKINPQLPLPRQLSDKYNLITTMDISVMQSGKKTPKLDVAVDTLQPAEIAKLADDVTAILGDIRQYRTTYGDWYAANPELDRVINILANVPWTGDQGTTVVNTTTDTEGASSTNVEFIGLNRDIAGVVDGLHDMYSYLSVAPIRALTAELMPILNRALEVGERSLATYSDNNLA